jgi:sugar lactone lactonase YvrE
MRSLSYIHGFFIICILLCSNIYADNTVPTFAKSWGNEPKLDHPKGIAKDSDGNLYITDSDHGVIKKYNSSGKFILSIGQYGSNFGEFNNPTGIVLDKENNIYVSDSGNNRIQKINANGKYITSWGSYGIDNGQFDYPAGLSIDLFNNLYVADTYNNRIQKFTLDGKFIKKWGKKGITNGAFEQPSAIATDSKGNIYVVDKLNQRIQKFDNNGVFKLKWGGKGSNNGQFNSIQNIRISSTNVIYVLDNTYNGSNIKTFTENGTFLSKISLPLISQPILVDKYNAIHGYLDPVDFELNSNTGFYIVDVASQCIWNAYQNGAINYSFGGFYDLEKPSLFNHPTGVATDSKNNIYVAQQANARVQKFDKAGNYLAQVNLEELTHPADIAVDSKNNLYVLGYVDNTVFKFDANLKLIKSWGGTGTNNGQFQNPFAIAIDKQDNIYITDTNNHRIQIFDSEGIFKNKLGGYGTVQGKFNYPHGIAFDKAGNLYVADTYNNRIQIFSSQNKFIRQWLPKDPDPSKSISFLADIAIDNADNLYIADTGIYSSRIIKFSTLGKFLGSWGAFDPSGNNNGLFYGLGYISTDNLNSIYVTDSERIQLFTYAPTLSASYTNNKVQLIWNDLSNFETSFRLERCTGTNCTTYQLLANLPKDSTSYVDSTVVKNTSYKYRIRMNFPKNIEGSYSNIFAVLTKTP